MAAEQGPTRVRTGWAPIGGYRDDEKTLDLTDQPIDLEQPNRCELRSFTLHVTFLARSEAESIDEATRMVMLLADDHPSVGVDDWEVSDTVDWSELLDRASR